MIPIPDAITDILLCKLFLLNKAELHRDLLGMEGWQELEARIATARTGRELAKITTELGNVVRGAA